MTQQPAAGHVDTVPVLCMRTTRAKATSPGTRDGEAQANSKLSYAKSRACHNWGKSLPQVQCLESYPEIKSSVNLMPPSEHRFCTHTKVCIRSLKGIEQKSHRAVGSSL